MITVGDIIPDAEVVLGTCDRTIVLNKINEAIELLSNEGHWDPLVGFMDICTQCNVITLPNEVEVPLAVNVGGHPANFRDKWFEFHLNGPGSCCNDTACDFTWDDMGDVVTFRDMQQPSRLAAYPDVNEGNDLSFRVYGYDQNDKWITEMDCVTGKCVDGALVPILYGYGSGTPSETIFKRITRISKPETRCFVKLVAFDPGNEHGGTLIGYYRPKELEPQYRRIRVSGGGCGGLTQCCTSTWVRMRFRRKIFKVENDYDMIPLHSRSAIKLALMSINKYEKDLIQESQLYLQQAITFINKEQKTRSGPNVSRVQFVTDVYGCSPGENMI